MHLTAYYFRAHSYTIVPQQVRQDMEWMAEHGTNAVALGILEQDLSAAVENYQLVCREIQRVGMKAYATPSRWGALVAGCPKVPSTFCATNPQAMVKNKNGDTHIGWLGPVASVHHPDTYEFFCSALDKMFKLFPIEGVIWDEVKNLKLKDYSPHAREALKGKDIDDINVHIDATADFFDRINSHIIDLRPDTNLSMFLYGWLRGYEVERFAAMQHLHAFGCDGRPFRKTDKGSGDSGQEAAPKTLCDDGPYFIAQARKNNKEALMLIENHAMKPEDTALMDKRLPEVISLGAEQLLYYYYPRSLAEPEQNMEVIAKHIRNCSQH